MNRTTGGAPDAAKRRLAGGQNASEFVRGVWLELRRVTWPTRDEWVSATILTVVLVVAIGLFTWACDYLFNIIFSAIRPVGS